MMNNFFLSTVKRMFDRRSRTYASTPCFTPQMSLLKNLMQKLVNFLRIKCQISTANMRKLSVETMVEHRILSSRTDSGSASERALYRFTVLLLICRAVPFLQENITQTIKSVPACSGLSTLLGLVKTMYALTYTKPGHAKPSRGMWRMDDRQQELYRLVENWVRRNLGNA